MIRAALFDMDGLLLDTERVGLGAFVDVIAPYGLPSAAASAFYISIVGTTGKAAEAAFSALGLDVSFGVIDLAWRAEVDARLAADVPLRPTVWDTVTTLARAQVPMAVVTSTHVDRARVHLQHAGLLRFFVDVIGGDQVQNPKPAPEPYLVAAARVGLPAQAFAAFEDSDTGTRAAVAAGCAVWQIPDLRPPQQAFPELGQRRSATLADAVQEAGLFR